MSIAGMWISPWGWAWCLTVMPLAVSNRSPFEACWWSRRCDVRSCKSLLLHSSDSEDHGTTVNSSELPLASSAAYGGTLGASAKQREGLSLSQISRKLDVTVTALIPASDKVTREYRIDPASICAVRMNSVYLSVLCATVFLERRPFGLDTVY